MAVGRPRRWLLILGSLAVERVSLVAFEGVAGDEPRYPALGDPVVARDLRLAAAFDEYGGDDQAGFRHPWKSG